MENTNIIRQYYRINPRWLWLLSGVLLVVFMYRMMWLPDSVMSIMYDLTHFQQPIKTEDEVMKQLQKLEIVKGESLAMTNYAKTTGILDPEFQKRFLGEKLYKIEGRQRYMYLVGTIRVCDFLTDEKPWNRLKPNYLKLDPKLLAVLRRLFEVLEKEGHDHKAISVYSGFRYPHYNRSIGSEDGSQHIDGRAVDIRFGDLNKDGHSDNQDRLLLYSLIKKRILRDYGGIGLYESGYTMHLDVREKKGQWKRCANCGKDSSIGASECGHCHDPFDFFFAF